MAHDRCVTGHIEPGECVSVYVTFLPAFLFLELFNYNVKNI